MKQGIAEVNEPELLEELGQDDMLSQAVMIDFCRSNLGRRYYTHLDKLVNDARENVTKKTAWRIEGTLREFSKFPPVNMYFEYPVHKIDRTGVLKDIDLDNNQPIWKKGIKARKSPEVKKKDRKESIETAFDACSIDGEVTTKSVAEYLGVTEKTARNRIKEHGGFWIEEGKIGRKS